MTPIDAGPTAPWPNRFAMLGPRFYTALAPTGLPDPHWVATSPATAALLGWPADWADRPDWQALQVLAGNAAWPGMQPLASVYSGHQFGVWAGQLGTGAPTCWASWPRRRGRWRSRSKAPGSRPYSRMGDGRAVLRPSIREFLCSEAMAALGIPTTRALAVVGSALPVRRERIETGAVVTRVAPSFLRFGHFEHFAHHGEHEALRELLDHTLHEHAPHCLQAPEPAVALLQQVAEQTAALMAHWQAVGFCHGVMNTDNMSLLGLTLDYGPFGFLDGFDPGHICNHSDERGRYAYARQPSVAFWNLHALAHALVPLLDGDREAAGERLLDAVEAFKPAFKSAMLRQMGAKLGIRHAEDGDQALIDELLQLLAAARADFTRSFRSLARAMARSATTCWTARPLMPGTRAGRPASAASPSRRPDAAQQPGRGVAATTWPRRPSSAAEGGDFSEVQRLLKVLSTPYDEPERADDAALPPDWAQHLEVSCSS